MENQNKILKKYMLHTDDACHNASILKLNDDCLYHVFSFLPFANRIRLQRVCKRWQTVSKMPWANINKLDFIKSNWVSDNEPGLDISYLAVKQVLMRCGNNIKHINFVDSYQNICFTLSDVLTTVTIFCPNIQSLDLSCVCCSITALDILAENCNTITDFGLGICEVGVEIDESLSTLFSKMERLCSLRMVETKCSINCFKYFPKNYIEDITLESVYLNGFDEYFFTNFMALHTLKITHKLNYLSLFLKGISQNPLNLKNLILHNYSVFDTGDYYPINDISCDVFKLINLQTLELGGEILTTNSLLKIEKYCKQLERATLRCSSNLPSFSLTSFAALPKLEYLNLVELNCSYITDCKSSYVYNLKTLICISCHSLTTYGFESLIKQNLEYLEVRNCMRVSNDKLIKLAMANTKFRNETVLKLCVEKSKSVRQTVNVSPFLQVIEDVIQEHL